MFRTVVYSRPCITLLILPAKDTTLSYPFTIYKSSLDYYTQQNWLEKHQDVCTFLRKGIGLKARRDLNQEMHNRSPQNLSCIAQSVLHNSCNTSNVWIRGYSITSFSFACFFCFVKTSDMTSNSLIALHLWKYILIFSLV